MAGPTDSGRRPRVGILGGTFDPPHVGHAIVAQDLVERLDLDRLLVVPAGDPPHRDTVFAAGDRLAWTRRVFRDAAPIEVSDVEHRRPGPSYTVDTLEELAGAHPDVELLLIMGADQFALLDTWKEPERLAGLARIAVMRRGGEEPAPPRGVDGIEYIATDVTRIDVSASQIRDRLASGRPIRFLVPDAVRRDIERAWAAVGPAARSEPTPTGR
ncbi:MAG: nicotinate (nicotinamide) nucleotide adenylyltransferase [Gemmatimonadota bacterium]|nr:nicotinate (nicotinamide) nucleotide adenylyltransferase [Gemmatimonadota bacterium]